MGAMNHGQLAEGRARDLAARLGVPDFVYMPSGVTKGASTREVSDGLLVAGGRGLILQVKSREPRAAARDRLTRAESWMRKKAAEAVAQAAGSRRRLARGGDVLFTSMRGFERTLPSGVTWPAVVILDHPGVASVELPPEVNTMFITLSDWETLHERLRSTDAVIDYVHRCVDSGLQPPVGLEHLRYDRIAAVDAAYASGPRALARVPDQPLRDEEQFAVSVFDELVEKVADPENEGWSDDYVQVVELLDRQPILLRVVIGEKMIRTFRNARATGVPQGFMAMDRNEGDRLAFFYDVEADPEVPYIDRSHIADVGMYGTLRHVQSLETGAPLGTVTLAVGIRHHEQFGRRYAFALLDGPAPDLPIEQRRVLEAWHGRYDFGRRRMFASLPGRNDPCGCGSGLKFKRCCLAKSRLPDRGRGGPLRGAVA